MAYDEETDVVLATIGAKGDKIPVLGKVAVDGQVPGTTPPITVEIRSYADGPAKVVLRRVTKKGGAALKRSTPAEAVALGRYLAHYADALMEHAEAPEAEEEPDDGDEADAGDPPSEEAPAPAKTRKAMKTPKDPTTTRG